MIVRGSIQTATLNRVLIYVSGKRRWPTVIIRQTYLGWLGRNIIAIKISVSVEYQYVVVRNTLRHNKREQFCIYPRSKLEFFKDALLLCFYEGLFFLYFFRKMSIVYFSYPFIKKYPLRQHHTNLVSYHKVLYTTAYN